MLDPQFWNRKKVFVTGHTGFKGAWLSLLLSHLGARVYGYSLPAEDKNLLFRAARVADSSVGTYGDVADEEKLQRALQDASPEVVIHLAAQPLVIKSYEEPLETIKTNVLGTANLLFAASKTTSVRAILNATTDKCYKNEEWVWGYRETDSLGGDDPYSASKAASEIITQAMYKSFFAGDHSTHKVGVATARAGNVIGGGDRSEHRIVPDIIRSLDDGGKITLRNPNALRPWQHVLEPLWGYLMLCQHLAERPTSHSGAWNFGPDPSSHLSVGDLTKQLVECLEMPQAKIDIQKRSEHETHMLKLDSTKARTLLGWSPKLSMNDTVQAIAQWETSYRAGQDMHMQTLNQIKFYLG